MKKIFSIISASLLLLNIFITSAFAAASPQRLIDNANVLNPNEKASISSRLDELKEEFDYDICIVTVNNVSYFSAEIAADKLMERYGVGSNVVMLMVTINRGEREWHVFYYNDADVAINEHAKDEIFCEMQNAVDGDNYKAAFNAFIDECEYYIDGYINGFPFEFTENLIISLVVGLIIAFVVVSIMKGKLKSVAFQRDASNYIKSGSMKVNVSRDFFLYRTITRTAKPKNNTSGVGRTPSGGSHSSRKF